MVHFGQVPRPRFSRCLCDNPAPARYRPLHVENRLIVARRERQECIAGYDLVAESQVHYEVGDIARFVERVCWGHHYQPPRVNVFLAQRLRRSEDCVRQESAIAEEEPCVLPMVLHFQDGAWKCRRLRLRRCCGACTAHTFANRPNPAAVGNVEGCQGEIFLFRWRNRDLSITPLANLVSFLLCHMPVRSEKFHHFGPVVVIAPRRPQSV